jgi:dolichol-phosphate mannosyltransferase
MDADLQHPPESLPAFVKALDESKFVIGTRYGAGKMDESWPLYRQVISVGARMLALPLTSLSDPMTGYFGLKKSLLNNKISPIGFKIGMEIYVKCGVKNHLEVPIDFGVRVEGESKLSSKVIVNYVYHLIQLYWFKFQFLIVLAVILFGLGLSYVFQVYLQ